MTSTAKRLPVALAVLCLALPAAPASAAPIATHLPARGTDVAARDQQAPRGLAQLPALGTNVAAFDQQEPAASAPVPDAAPSGGDISPLTIVLVVIAIAAMAASAVAAYTVARGRRRVPLS